MEEELNIIPANALPNASESDIENGNIIIVNSDGDVKKADALAMKGRKGDKGDQVFFISNNGVHTGRTVIMMEQ